MQGVIRGKTGAETYLIDGKEVSKAEFERHFPDVAESTVPRGTVAGSSLVGFKKMTSEALAVHPDQVHEAEEYAKRSGVPTEYQASGEPVIRSSRHFRALAKIQGFRHKGY